MIIKPYFYVIYIYIYIVTHFNVLHCLYLLFSIWLVIDWSFSGIWFQRWTGLWSKTSTSKIRNTLPSGLLLKYYYCWFVKWFIFFNWWFYMWDTLRMMRWYTCKGFWCCYCHGSWGTSLWSRSFRLLARKNLSCISLSFVALEKKVCKIWRVKTV